MGFPPFGNFLESLGEDGIDKIMDAHFKEISGDYDLSDPNFLNEILSKCVVCSVRSSIDLMECYHRWLSESVVSQTQKKD